MPLHNQVNIYDCVFRSVLRNSNATANVTANATSNATDNATTEGYAVTLEYNGEVSASLERNTYTSDSVSMERMGEMQRVCGDPRARSFQLRRLVTVA